MLIAVLDWVNHYGSGLSAVATLLTAAIAIVAIARSTADSRARSQPQVLAEFRIARDADTTIDLVLRNAGPTPARRLQVRFDPPLVVPDTGRTWATEVLVERYDTVIPTLGPGQELTNIWWSGGMNGAAAELVNQEPTPDSTTVEVRYRGIGHHWLRDRFPLDVSFVMNNTYSVSSDSPRAQAKDKVDLMKSISNSLQTLARKATTSR